MISTTPFYLPKILTVFTKQSVLSFTHSHSTVVCLSTKLIYTDHSKKTNQCINHIHALMGDTSVSALPKDTSTCY